MSPLHEVDMAGVTINANDRKTKKAQLIGLFPLYAHSNIYFIFSTKLLGK